MAPVRWWGPLLCLAALAGTAGAQDTADSTLLRTAKVTYVTSVSAYIDAGRDEGLVEGALVEVMRDGAAIGVLKVAFLASHQASCEFVSQSVATVVGDVVRFTAVPPPPAPKPDSTVAVRPGGRAQSAASAARARRSLRGRVGVHYLAIGQNGGGGFTQPSLDLRLDGRPFGDAPVAMAVDVRARRTASNFVSGGTTTDGHTRAYQLALSWNRPGSPARITVGRQFAPGLASVGTFDGVLAEVNGPRWSMGVFSGSQPEPLNLGFTTNVVEVGGFVQRRGRTGAGTRQWAVALGASGSYEDAHANREFAFLQASVLDRRLAASISQEIDYYRWWKRTPGMASVSLTSTFATLRYRVSDRLTFNGGFDNRRNVLLYRDVVNPVTAFDDAFRQGIWAGMGLQVARRYRVGFDARQSSGGAAGRSSSYTLSLGADRLAAGGLGARLRSTYYDNPRLSGWLHAATLAADPWERVHLELTGGARLEREPLADPASRSITWFGADVDWSLGRAWYLLASVNRERGAGEGTNQLYAGLSARF